VTVEALAEEVKGVKEGVGVGEGERGEEVRRGTGFPVV